MRQRLCDRHRVALREKRPPKQQNKRRKQITYVRKRKNLFNSLPLLTYLLK